MNTKRSRRWLAPALALVAAVSLTLSSCGADSSKGSTTKDVDVSNGGLKGDPIVLGFICSCTGPLAPSIGRSADVIKAWGSWVNNHGGINGHPVKVVTYDDGQTPAKGLAAAKKLVEQDHVQAIVGQMSLVTTSWASYVDGKGVPVVGGQPVDTPFFTDPNFFASGTTLPLMLLAEVSAAKEAGAKNFGVFYCSETPICAQLPKIFGALGQQAGLKVESTKISQSAPNYIAPCLEFKHKSVDAINVGTNSDAVPRVVDSCAKQGFTPINVATSNSTQKNWLDDKNLDGSVYIGNDANYTDTNLPGVKDFNDALDKYAGHLKDSPQFSSPMIYPWAGGQLFAAAAEAANLTPTSTPADVKKGLYALKDETLGGVSGPLNFVEGQPGGTLCYFAGTIKDGAFNSGNGGKPTCVDPATVAALMKALAG